MVFSKNSREAGSNQEAPSFSVWTRLKSKFKYQPSTESKKSSKSTHNIKVEQKRIDVDPILESNSGETNTEGGYPTPSEFGGYESNTPQSVDAITLDLEVEGGGEKIKDVINEILNIKSKSAPTTVTTQFITPLDSPLPSTPSSSLVEYDTSPSVALLHPRKEDRVISLDDTLSAEECNVKHANLKTLVTLGAGAFGRVDLVKDTVTNQSFALKTISKVKVSSKPSSIAHLYNEKRALQTIESDFIVKMYKTFNLDDKVCFLFEPILGGELFTFMQINKRFTEKMAKYYAACAIVGIEDIHANGMVYRDLKPENLLISSDGRLKFADFGFAKTIKPWAKTFSLVGTPEYLPPEIIANEGHDRGFDMWTLGVLIFEMLSRRTPFHDRHRRTMFNKICNVSYTFPSYFPASAADLVRRLLRRRPIYRLGVVAGISAIKEHPWFDGFDWDALRAGTMKAPYVPKIRSTTDASNFVRVNKDKIPKFPEYTKDQAI
eukprot:304985_1